MQLVNDRFYYWYNRIVTLLGFGLLVGSALAYLVPSLRYFDSKLGFSLVTGGIALTQIIYGMVFFRREVKKAPSIAGMLASMFMVLNIINLAHNTGQLHSWYMIAWGAIVFFSSIFGLYAMVGAQFLITFYFILLETGQAGVNQIDALSVGVVLASYFVGVIGYALWKRFYIDDESRKVRQLTGQLRNKQQQAEVLIQSITDGMIVVATDGTISLMNPAASRMTDWPVEESSGIDVKQVIKLFAENGREIEPLENPFQKVFESKTAINQVLQLVSRSGKKLTVSLVVSPVTTNTSKDVSGAIAIIRDISNSRAEERKRADFISTASHEMRTPVAAIEGYLALALNDKVASIDSKARSYLEKAHASSQHLGKLFQDLLTSAKAEDGRLVNHPVVVEMGSFLEQLADSLKFAAEKKGLLMDFVVGKGSSKDGEVAGKVIKPLYYVYADPDRLREVITNLFDNAVKYTERGRVTLALTGNNNVVQLYVRDTGPGIPSDDIPHLFQKFYRVDSSATRTIGGTGLGLFICRKIIELYGGRIWVESEVDKGSTFYINIPRISNEKANKLQVSEASQVPDISKN
jgi:PAS domain S-box-containing protein